MSDPRPYAWLVAVHEAGHFVFGNLVDIGTITELTIRPHERRHGARGFRSAGACAYRRCATEAIVDAERSGKAASALLKPHVLPRWPRIRERFINQLVIFHVAGVAAESALAGGSDKLDGLDDVRAKEDAALIVHADEVNTFIARRMVEAKQLCAGPYRAAIVAVAERLVTKRTLDEQACAALWQEVDPRNFAAELTWGSGCSTA